LWFFIFGKNIPMKPLVLALLLLLAGLSVRSQTKDDYIASPTPKMFKITKQNGSVFFGIIKKEDAREVLVETKVLGEVYIPRHEIQSMVEIKQDAISETGEYIAPLEFSSRYFFTTNGLPIKKGEGYIRWSLLGPDIQIGVADNFGVGLITTWIGLPLVANLKYSIKLQKDVHLGLGALLGSGSWLAPRFMVALPFAALTLGNERKNINFSLGYGGYNDPSGFLTFNASSSSTFLCSFAAYARVSNKVAFVLDSFILPIQSFGFVSPGFRFGLNDRTSFQLGFTGIVSDLSSSPLPFPNVQLFQKF
jgi:hypothetical protein